MSDNEQAGGKPATVASDSYLLRRKIIQLGKQAEQRATAGRRKTRIFLGMGAVLVALLMVSLSGLTIQIRRLDTEALVQLGRIEVQKRMPDGRSMMEDYLEREAPRLVGGAMAGLVGLLPELRQLLVKDLNHRLDTITAVFEKRMLDKIGNVVYKTKLDIDLAWPNESDSVKLGKLVDAVAKDFNKVFEIATNELYPDYAAELRQITVYLAELDEKDLASMSKADRLHKGIIETMILLSRREKKGH